jgi:hypothetical protein
MVIFAPIFQLGCCKARSGRDVLQLFAGKVPERSARCGQNHAFDILAAMSFERLKDGAVLAVDGENADMVFLGFRLHQCAGHDHRLFIGERDLFAGSNGRQRREQPCAADDGGNDQFSFRRLRDFGHAFGPARS